MDLLCVCVRIRSISVLDRACLSSWIARGESHISPQFWVLIVPPQGLQTLWGVVGSSLQEAQIGTNRPAWHYYAEECLLSD